MAAGDWLVLADAATKLGLSAGAARKRCERGMLVCERRHGRLYVAVDASGQPRDGEATEATARDYDRTKRDTTASHGHDSATVALAALQAEVAVLREALASEREARRRADHLLAGLIERVPALPETAGQQDAAVATNPAPGRAETAHMTDNATRPETSLLSRLLRWLRGGRDDDAG